MGYSARYHAASLIAVFVALAVGILIGVGLGENVVSNTEENLRESLEGDLNEARADADELGAELDREREFASRAYPALVGDRLTNRRVGVIAFGDLGADVSDDVEAALDPTGAELAEVIVLRVPPDLAGLSQDLRGTRFARVDRRPEQLDRLAEVLGRQLVRGSGGLLGRTRDVLLARSSGERAPLDGVVLFREEPAIGESERFQAGIVEGVRGAGPDVVAVERTDSETSVPFFSGLDVTTVDDVDLTAGRVAMVFGLRGADGNFGVKDTADRLLPELLEPRR